MAWDKQPKPADNFEVPAAPPPGGWGDHPLVPVPWDDKQTPADEFDKAPMPEILAWQRDTTFVSITLWDFAPFTVWDDLDNPTLWDIDAQKPDLWTKH